MTYHNFVLKRTLLDARIDIVDIGIFLYLFSIVFANGTVLFYAASSLLVLLYLIKYGMPRFNKPFILLSSLFLVFSLFQIIFGFAEYPQTSFNRLLVVLINYVISVILFNYLDKPNKKKVTAHVFLFLLVAFLIYALISNFSGILSGRFGDNVPYFLGLNGVNGEYMNSNDVGRAMYTGLLVLFVINYLNGIKKPLFILLLIIFFSFTIFTGSRISLIVGAGFLAVYFVVSAKKVSTAIVNIIIVTLIAILLSNLIMNVSFLYEIMGRRIETLFNGSFLNRSMSGSGDGDSAYSRFVMINDGIAIFVKRPILGWGLFAYSQMDMLGTYSHSNFIEMLISGGIIGFVVYYLPLLYLLTLCFKGVLHSKDKTIYSILFAFLLVKLMANMFDIDYVNRIALFDYYFIAACLASLQKINAPFKNKYEK